MNKIVNYVSKVFVIIVAVYVGWIAIKTAFPIDEWFQQNPSWKTIFCLLAIVYVIVIMLAIVKSKGK